jgi:hypothetical protein
MHDDDDADTIPPNGDNVSVNTTNAHTEPDALPLGGVVVAAPIAGWRPQYAKQSKVNTLGPRVLQLVRDGYSLRGAAAVCGIAHTTIMSWLKNGEPRVGEGAATDPAYAQFAQAYRALEAVIERKLLEHVEEAANGDTSRNWRAAAWLLGARWPDRYREQVTTAELPASSVVVVHASNADAIKLGRTDYDDEG